MGEYSGQWNIEECFGNVFKKLTKTSINCESYKFIEFW